MSYVVPNSLLSTPPTSRRSTKACVIEAKITDGRVFRSVNRHSGVGAALSDQSVAFIIKKRAVLVGLDACEFSGHSLRAGLATATALSKVEQRLLMRQTRHTGVTARRYIGDGEVLVRIASGRVQTAVGAAGSSRTQERQRRWLVARANSTHRHHEPTHRSLR